MSSRREVESKRAKLAIAETRKPACADARLRWDWLCGSR